MAHTRSLWQDEILLLHPSTFNICSMVLIIMVWVPARAEQRSLRIGVAKIDALGVEEEPAQAVQEAVVEALTEQGVELPPLTGSRPLDQACITDPDCMAATAQEAGLDGVVATRLVQVGPVVTITLSFYDARNGMRVTETSTRVKTKQLLNSFSPAQAVARGIQALSRLRGRELESSPVDPAGAPESTAEEAATESSPLPVLGWSGAGLGGLLLAAGGAVGVWWVLLRGEQASCADSASGCSRQTYDEITSSFETTGWAAPILMGSGLAVAAAGVTVALLARDEVDEGKTPQ